MARFNKSQFCKSQYNWESLRVVKLTAQESLCAICNKQLKTGGSAKDSDTACLDHEHSTGKVRSVLCFNCNIGLGYFCDNPTLLLKAAQYLNKWQRLRGLYFNFSNKLSKRARIYEKL